MVKDSWLTRLSPPAIHTLLTALEGYLNPIWMRRQSTVDDSAWRHQSTIQRQQITNWLGGNFSVDNSRQLSRRHPGCEP
jgi:hypothetical protein